MKAEKKKEVKSSKTSILQKVVATMSMLSLLLMNSMVTYAASNGTQVNNKWSISEFLKNATSNIKYIAGLAIMLFGVIMVVVGVWQIGTGFMSHGKKQTNWFIAIALLIVGGALMTGGFNFVADIASGGQQTIKDLGNGTTQTILPMTGQSTVLPLTDGSQLSVHFE